MKNIFASVIIAVGIFAPSIFGSESIGVKGVQDMQILAPGVEAPLFSLPQVIKGETSRDYISLRAWCGKELSRPRQNPIRHTIILSFWATYCVPCKKEMPELMRFAQKHTTDSIKVFCVSIDKEGVDIVDPYVKEHKMTVPVLIDQYSKTAQRYGVNRLPALVVIDPMGIIRYSSIGYDSTTTVDAVLESVIAKIKAKRN